MIEEKVECKRLGYEYRNLFEKLIYFIRHTPFAKDYIGDNDLKMLSDLDVFLHSGKYEIIEFGTNKSSFDCSDIIKEQKEKIEDLQEQLVYCDIWRNEYRSRVDKSLDYMFNNQLVFRLSSKKQIEDWFDDFYKNILDILRGENNE